MNLDSGKIDKLIGIILVGTIFVLFYNMVNLQNVMALGSQSSQAAIQGIQGGSTVSSLDSVIPKGVPPIYGTELGISFDDVSAYDQAKADSTIGKLGLLDQQLELTGQDLERYINVLYKKENGISCEYCCGARAIIFENGQAACGCAHSYAMRGLAKYLILNHGDEFSDDELLEEVGKWKTLFFPSQITQKASILESQGIELNYINLASNKYRGIEEGKSGTGMVGGC